jgi:hypothetical protein
MSCGDNHNGFDMYHSREIISEQLKFEQEQYDAQQYEQRNNDLIDDTICALCGKSIKGYPDEDRCNCNDLHTLLDIAICMNLVVAIKVDGLRKENRYTVIANGFDGRISDTDTPERVLYNYLLDIKQRTRITLI